MKLSVIVILNFNPPFDSFYKLWTQLGDYSAKKHPNIQIILTTNHDNIELNTCQKHVMPSGHAVYTTPDDKYRLISEIKENYTSALIVKTWNAIEFALQQDEKPDFILRTNACSIWNWEKFLKKIETFPKTGVYSGIVGNYGGLPFVSGAGILFSADVASKLIQLPHTISVIDDVYIAQLLKKIGINAQNRGCTRKDYIHGLIQPEQEQKLAQLLTNFYHIRFHEIGSSLEQRLKKDVLEYKTVLDFWYSEQDKK